MSWVLFNAFLCRCWSYGIYLLFFLTWCIIFINLHILNYPCIPRINLTSITTGRNKLHSHRIPEKFCWWKILSLQFNGFIPAVNNMPGGYFNMCWLQLGIASRKLVSSIFIHSFILINWFLLYPATQWCNNILTVARDLER